MAERIGILRQDVVRPSEQLLQRRAVEQSFGTINAACHGLPSNIPVVEARNYVNEDPEVSPITLARGDVYLNYLAAATLGRKGEAISFPLLLGLPEHYEEIGLTHSAIDLMSRVHQVNPEIRSGEVLGHPFTNVVDLAVRQGLRFDGRRFSATFPTQDAVSQMAAMGAESFQQADHKLATKAFLREKAQEYGIQMTQGGVVRTPEDLQRIVAELNEQGTRKVWVKLPFASGGDGVVPLEGAITEERVSSIIEELSRSFDDVFTQGDFGGLTRDDIWQRGTIAPASGIVIERDVQDEMQHMYPGCTVDICSNALEVDINGEVRLVGEFTQLTDAEGNFFGSVSAEHDDATKAMLDVQNKAAANFVRQELNHAGVMGTDYALVRDSNGRIVDDRFIEINLRDPISWSAQSAARKIYDAHRMNGSFINTNLELPTAICSMDDFHQAVTIPGVCSSRGHLQNGLIVPIAFRSLSAQIDGRAEVVAANRLVKCLILGRDGEHTQFIRSQLQQLGI